jgi:CheY-like chemotaxis protein
VPRLFLIDDEPGIRLALRRWFERRGWEVVEAGDGEAALGLLDGLTPTSTPDLIVCDLNLPKATGGTILAHLADRAPALVSRFVLTTGEDVANAEPGTALHDHPLVLQKPFDFTALQALVQQVTGL